MRLPSPSRCARPPGVPRPGGGTLTARGACEIAVRVAASRPRLPPGRQRQTARAPPLRTQRRGRCRTLLRRAQLVERYSCSCSLGSRRPARCSELRRGGDGVGGLTRGEVGDRNRVCACDALPAPPARVGSQARRARRPRGPMAAASASSGSGHDHAPPGRRRSRSGRARLHGSPGGPPSLLLRGRSLCFP